MALNYHSSELKTARFLLKGCFNSDSESQRLVPFFRSTLGTKDVLLSWGTRGCQWDWYYIFSKENDLFPSVFSPVFRNQRWKKVKTRTINCFVPAHLPCFSLHVHPLLSASQKHQLPFSPSDMLCFNVLRLENFPPSLPESSSIQISCKLITSSRKSSLDFSELGQSFYHRLSIPTRLFWSTDHSCTLHLFLWLFYFLTRLYALWQQGLCMFLLMMVVCHINELLSL